MNKIYTRQTFSIFLCLLSWFNGALLAMEAVVSEDAHLQRQVRERSEAEVSCVTVHNQTGHKIAIRFHYAEESDTACLSLVPDQSITLDCTNPLAVLEVSVYGRNREWLSRETLTRGLYEQQNFAQKINDALKQFPRKHVCLTVTYGGGWVGEGILRSAVGELLPYSCCLTEGVKKVEP